MLSRRRFLAILGGGGVAVGVATLGFRLLPGGEAEAAFPVIHLGEESCSFCGMNIGDVRFTSAWRAPSGERHFDDIGCMVNAYRRHHPVGDTRFFVHDYSSGAWLDANNATFAISTSVKTPMAYGVFATAIQAGQSPVATPDGLASLGWSGLMEQLERRS